MVLADVAFVSAEIVYFDKKTDYSNCCTQAEPKGFGSGDPPVHQGVHGPLADPFRPFRRHRLVNQWHAKSIWCTVCTTEWKSILSRGGKLLWSL